MIQWQVIVIILLFKILRIAPNYVHEDIVVSALIGTTDASSFLGTNENNVDFCCLWTW